MKQGYAQIERMVQATLDGLTGLVRLIYASRWAVPEGRVLDEEVRKIVIASMNNNRLVNVTGLLLVHDGWFVQALEGPAAGVRETYERVAMDQRHTDVTLIVLWDGQGGDGPGGTADMVALANGRGVKVVRLDASRLLSEAGA